MIEQIAQASAEQAEGISQVNKAIAQIDSGTQQNAALVEETSAAAESLNDQAKLLREDMARFTTHAHSTENLLINKKTQIKSDSQDAQSHKS